MLIALIIVWALVLSVSPGLALIGVALTLLVVDRYDRRVIDRLLGDPTR